MTIFLAKFHESPTLLGRVDSIDSLHCRFSWWGLIFRKICKEDLLINIFNSLEGFFDIHYDSNVSVNSNWVHPPPLATPWKIFLSERIPATRQNFLSNSLPPGKKWWSNSRGWGKIFPSSKKLLLKLAKKSLKNWENYETVQLFYLENLKNLYVLDWSRTTRKSLNTPALIFN